MTNVFIHDEKFLCHKESRKRIVYQFFHEIRLIQISNIDKVINLSLFTHREIRGDSTKLYSLSRCSQDIVRIDDEFLRNTRIKFGVSLRGMVKVDDRDIDDVRDV